MNKLELSEVFEHEVKKSNYLAMSAQFDLTATEQKILNYITTLIKPPTIDEGGKLHYTNLFEIDFSKFCKMAGMKICGASYNVIRKSLLSMYRKKIEVKLPEKNTFTGLGILDRYEYKDNEGYAVILLDDRMTPYLFELKNNFLKYQPQYTMLLKSKFSIRIYEWIKSILDKEISLKQKKYKNEINFNNLSDEEKKEKIKEMIRIRQKKYQISLKLNDIKKFLSLSKNYYGYNTIYSQILAPAIKEINELSDIYIENCEYDNELKFVTFDVRLKDIKERHITDDIIEEKINSVNKKSNK